MVVAAEEFTIENKWKSLAEETLNELRPRREKLDDKVEGWLAAAGGFFAASGVMVAFSGHPIIAGFVGLVLLASGWLRIIYFRTKIIWIEDAAFILNSFIVDEDGELEKLQRVIKEKDGCARKENLWEGVAACPYTAMTMGVLLLAQTITLMLAFLS